MRLHSHINKASVRIDGKQKTIGQYENLADAVLARKQYIYLNMPPENHAFVFSGENIDSPQEDA